MSATFMLATGVAAVVVAVGWWVGLWVRIWRTRRLLRQVVQAHDRLRADVQARHARICTEFVDRSVWTEQKLADLEWVFAEIDPVLERRRLENLAVVGRSVPAVAPPLIPVVLGGLGAVALVAGLLMER